MARSDASRPATPELARFARQLADPSRAAMMIALMDGRAWTVGELARQAGIARNTASEHLTRLADAGLVTQTRQGRHSYLSLSGNHVAEVVESMCRAAGVAPATRSLRGQRYDAELAEGRTCYRHLAGRLGVGLADRWIADGVIGTDWSLTDAGAAWFGALDIESPAGPGPVLRPCIDWTERRPHAAGPLAAELASRAFDRGWVVRGQHPRAAHLTPRGREALGLG
jgi:DNA-binding transcriptional ArsR family regulator